MKAANQLRPKSFDVNKRWATTPDVNYGSPKFYVLGEWRKQTFSITNFHFKIWWFLLSVGLIYGPHLVFAIIQTVFVFRPEWSFTGRSFYIWNYYFLIATVYFRMGIAFVLGIFFMVYFKKLFWTSGIFMLFFYVFLQLGFAVLGRLLERYAHVENFPSYWTYFLALVIIFVLAMILVPDLRRAFLLIFAKWNSVNSYLGRKLSVQPDPRATTEEPKPGKLKASLSAFALFLLIFIITFGGTMFANYITGIIESYLPKINNSNQSSIDETLGSGNFWLEVLPLYLLVLFGAPLVEELVFRVSFLSFGNRGTTSILLSGIVFGLIHTHADGLINVTGYLLFGLVLAFSYSLAGNYWIVFLVHFTNNLISVLV
ncbi:membrane protease YdiL (CAAX protease family) [Mycoplasmoides fastidiosum]|uniref:Membrane protease YdiL (CAAX protease family) n=1 Tax=Mycoplasmoides fastidiosum TaxID=92758 RepID=A0ABU0LZ69_9BACT|nr:CPBP family intramembrane glutamic endopeptidase [Mycoplasmoides fastidiosum]MDQ0513898.1 membrane protease YdiL (CAAX protease family) [Mycoplasmoides fastidiosum]UUD37688.1 CPBP family intramembrane metalloprotease [Mycoplasmoides fastidiosum]